MDPLDGVVDRKRGRLVAGDDEGGEMQEPRLPSEPLRSWERGIALVAGALTLGAGVIATFRTGNGAGSAVMLIVGSALLLVGIQGTPLIRVGGDSASIELERRRIVDRVVARAATETRPEVARSLLEAASDVAEGLRSYPASVAVAMYGMQVREACLRLGGLSVFDGLRDDGPDFTVSFEAHRDVRVIVTYFGTDSPARLRARLESIIGRVFTASALLPTLVVVDALPAHWERRLRETAPGARELLRDSLVKWSGPADDQALQRALEHAIESSVEAGMRGSHMDGPPARDA